LSRFLRKIKKNSPGLLQIIGNGIPDPQYSWYEANFILFKAMGRADWWVRIDSRVDLSWTVPRQILERDAYRTKYVLSTEMHPLVSHTIFRIDARNFIGLKNALINIFMNLEPASISLSDVESR